MLLRRDRAMLAVSIMLDVAFHAGRAAAGLRRPMTEPISFAI